MVSLKEIIANGKLEKIQEKEYPEIEMSEDSINIDRLTHYSVNKLKINDFRGFKEICELLDFPVLEENEMCVEENVDDLITFLSNLQIEFSNYGIKISKEIDGLKEKSRVLSKYAKDEYESDVLEVKLANLRREYGPIDRVNGGDLDRLKGEVAVLRERMSMVRLIELHQPILGDVYRFINNLKDMTRDFDQKGATLPPNDGELEKRLYEGVEDPKFLSIFGGVGDLDSYEVVVEELEMTEKIARIPDSPLKRLLLYLLENKSVKLTFLEKFLPMDRIGLLKIIYNLKNREIITFDRLNDIIELKE
jgi:hypothetical protein